LRLPVKIALLTILIAGIGVLWLAYSSFNNASDLLQKQALLRMGENIQKEAIVLSDILIQSRKDLLFVSGNLAVHEIFQAADEYGQQEQKKIETWKYRLETLFATILKHRSGYHQIRLIGAHNNGKEIVRMQWGEKKIISVEDNMLQTKGHRDYFKETIKLKKGQIYISDINLNQEHGVIEMPPNPVFRIATPVFAKGEQQPLGIIAINVKFTDLINSLLIHKPHAVQLFLAHGQTGEYLFHSDPNKSSKFEFGKGASLFDDIDNVNSFKDAPTNRGIETLNDFYLTNQSDGTDIIFQHVYFDPLDRERKFIIGAAISHHILKDESNQFLNDLIVLALATVIGLSITLTLAVKYLTTPIEKLTNIANQIAKGIKVTQIPSFREDEIGELASSFKLMLHNIDKKNKALQDSEKRISAIFDNTVEGILNISESGVIQSFNSACEKMFGYRADDVIGQNVTILMPEKYREKHESSLKNYVATNIKHIIGTYVEIEGIKKDGSIFPVLLTISEVQLEDSRIFSGIMRDITEQKKSEGQIQTYMRDLELAKKEAERANHLKSEFLANISHELRTPMHSIITFSRQGLERKHKWSVDDQMENLQLIHDSGDRLLLLINDLLDVSKLEAGAVSYQMSRLNLVDTVKMITGQVSGLLAEKKLKLDIVEPDTPFEAVYDKDKITQVILNLLSNAIKFTPQSSNISIAFEQQEGSPPSIKVSVIDEGIGIPEDELKTVFDKFIQSKKTKTGAGGTGLGLAICKEIIEAHHGSIWAINNDKKGATFAFQIPVTQPNEEEGDGRTNHSSNC